MKIEVPVSGLTKAKRNKVEGLVDFDDASGAAIFEWGGDEAPPHDYATAYTRARDAVQACGGDVTGEMRILG
jgi:hypothetical protein